MRIYAHRFSVFIVSIAFVWGICSTPANASVVESVVMNFESGAHFTGAVTFTDDFSSDTAVNGVLSGYTPTSTGYVGTGSDPITTVLIPATNYASGGPNIFGNWLADGDLTTVQHAILFTYDYTNAPTLVFADASAGFLGVGNSIDYQDPIISGSISPINVAAVPEPSSWLLLLLGLAGVAFLTSSSGRSLMARHKIAA
jgi:hypothetical protein